MKKIFSLLVVAVLVVATAFSLVACNKTQYKAVQMTDAEPESYGYAVNKGANANVLAAINEVIAADDFAAKRDEMVAYYTAIYGGEKPTALSFALPDLSDNTAGTLKVGTEAGFAPFEFSDSTYGVDGVAGLDIAIMMMAAEKLNYKLSVSDMTFGSLPAALQSGSIDVIAAGFTNDEERAKTMDFSANYFTSKQFIVCADDKDYATLASLKDLKIGVQMGTTGDFMVADGIEDGTLGNATAVQYQSITIAMQALKKGDIDCIVIDELPAQTLVANN